jgi:hypothetical protein
MTAVAGQTPPATAVSHLASIVPPPVHPAMDRRTALLSLTSAGALAALPHPVQAALAHPARAGQPGTLPQADLERLLRLAAVPSVAAATVERSRATC